MSKIIARVRVVLSAAVTWLTLAVTVLGIVAVQLEPFTDDPTIARVLGFIAAVLVAIRVIVAIISRVTEVLPAARGLLPPDDEGVAWTARERSLLAENDQLHQDNAQLRGLVP